MRGRSRAMAAAAGIIAVTLTAAACGGGGSSSSGNSGNTANEITVRGCTPQNPLVGGNTAEVCGGNMLDLITRKLVHYNVDTAAPELDLATAIDTKDNQHFDVKIQSGQKFSDGTPITAKSFVDAWNYTAYGPNGQQGSYFFEPIEGYAATQCTDDECKAKPKAETLSGLKVKSDTEFTITTSEKVSNLPVRLGYAAFSPQPEAFFSNPDSYKTKPISSGPYQASSINDTDYVFTKNPNYQGKWAGKTDKIDFRIYNDPSAAYTDVVANNLDVTDIIPPDQLVGDQWKSDLDGRNGTKPQGVIQAFGFSPIDSQLKNVNLRHAISMAVDRATIVKQIYNNTRTPADSFVSPVVQGYKAGACGQYCEYNPTEAKALYAKSPGYKGTLTFAYNQDGGHGPMATAVCNSIKNTLGIDCQPKSEPDFKTLRDQLNKRELKGIFRSGWQMDYPSIENFLAPIYAKGAASNDTAYDNPKFDAKLAQAAAAPTEEEANTLYQEAEQYLVQDMPAVPEWYDEAAYGWSNRVENVKTNAFGVIDYASITVKSS
ncbi:oligopeptide transport system substrate-binding protein [Friedmanniella endophytica]|uniref:Oligopeptide transport system substrate-binding protein n=1 Tax=Microlunatus kandeliicorticis TaxID=1759536 RepID=A0A7W3ISM3_9ACTN|nr:ABC transporter substrate-binding protein [Microlunatus kandeliicorticis]MBA8794512.1 oligopeptide transport system substrate-binding protein [Microlunatus kandeliicorticis]